MEGEELRAIVVEVGIETVEGAGGVGQTGESINTSMVVGVAAIISVWRMITAFWGRTLAPEIVVEGVIFLHHDDDVIDFFQSGLGERRVWRKGC